jgi:hypothetical protein
MRRAARFFKEDEEGSAWERLSWTLGEHKLGGPRRQVRSGRECFENLVFLDKRDACLLMLVTVT